MSAAGFTLGDLTRRNAELRADLPAIVFEGRSITHGEFGRKACRLASALAALGVKKGDRVAILSRNCPEYMEAYAAGELAGFITVTINFRLAPAEIDYILADSAPRALIVDAALIDKLSPEARRLVPHVVSFDGATSDLDYETLCASADESWPDAAVEPDDIAFLIYTSGTTGQPKGVMLSHASQVAAAHICALDAGIRPTDRFAVAMPLYHIGAKNLWLMNATQGGVIVLHRMFRPDAFFASLRDDDVTFTLLAPTMLGDLMDATGADRHKLPRLRQIMYSAAPMPEALLRRGLAAFGPIFTQVYGLTESGGPGTVFHAHRHKPDGAPNEVRRLRSAGQPMSLTSTRIMRADGAFAAPGEIGEVVIRGPAVMSGYWRNDAATRTTLVDGWLHTGDLGTSDEEGFIFVVDRLKEMIVSGGENIYSREVENAVTSCAGVIEAAVVGAPDERWGEKVVAFVVKRPDATLDAAGVIAHCRGSIAAYKCPKEVRFIEALPKLPNGKVEKYKLKAPLWDKAR